MAPRRVLTVLPDHASADLRAARILAGGGGRVLDGRWVSPLSRFLESLGRSALPGLSPLSPLSERHLLRGVLADAAREVPALSALFHGGRLPGGLVDATANAVHDCRGAEIGPEVLARSGGAPAQRLARILERFDARLEALGAVDAASLPGRLADALAAGAPLPAILEDAVEVEIEGRHLWSAAEVRLLEALARRLEAHGGGVTVLLPGDMGEGGAFAWLAAVKRLFEAMGASGVVHLGERLPSEGRARAALLSEVSEAFFAERAGAGGDGRVLDDGPLVVVSAPDAAAEAREVARRVKALVASGIPPEDVVVAARRLGGEAQVIVDALAAAGLPVHDRRGRPVRTVGPVRVLLDLYRAVLSSLPRDALLSVLASRYTDLGDETVRPATIARWIRRAGAVDLTGEGYAAAVDRAASVAREGEGHAVARRLEKVLPVVCELGRPGTVETQVRRVRRVAEVLALTRRVDAQAARLLSGEDPGPLDDAALEAVARDEAALEALEGALDDCIQVSVRLGEQRASLSPPAFLALLGDALDARTLSPAPLRGGAVELLAATDLAPRAARVLCLTGLADGIFPGRADEDPMLPDTERHRLNQALSRPAFTVLTEGDRVAGGAPSRRAEEALLFALALHVPTDHLVLSRSRTDESGRPQVASPYLVEVLEAAGGVEAEVPLAPVPAPEAATTPEALERALAATIYGPPPDRPGVFPVPRPLPAAVDRALGAGGVPLSRVVAPLSIERARHHYFLDPEVAAGPFTGATGPLPARARARLTGEGGALSVSTLQALAGCAFAALAARGLLLEPPEAHDETLDPLARGQLLHACLEAAWRAMDEAGHLPLAPSRTEAARAVALAAARRVCAHWPEKGHRGAPQLFDVEAEQALAIVGRLVEVECEADGGWALAGTELAFGAAVAERDVGWPALELADPGDPGGTHALRGRIDRLDRREGDGEAPPMLRVVDYKSGGASGLSGRLMPDALGVTELQLPAYLAAVRAHEDTAALDASFVALGARPPAHLSVAGRLASSRGAWKDLDLDVDALLDGDGERPGLAATVAALVARARTGDLGPRPAPGVCRSCDLADVCRIVVPASGDEGDDA